MMNVQNVEFIKSAAGPKDFIRDGRPLIVFAGKSNVGKSSVINCLLRRRNFARVGAQPGKTIHINYFLLDSRAYLTDLPGYGYAKVSKAERERWGVLMERFFAEAERISLGVLIVDSRHKPGENDRVMADWFVQTGRPMLLVANKLDKLKKSEIEGNLQRIREGLSLPERCQLLPFSAETGQGREALLARVASVWEGGEIEKA